MRLVAGVLSLALFAPLARAEDTATPPATSPTPPPAPAPIPAPPAPPAARVPFRVVRVMPETRQALLFDRSRNTHVLAEVGGKLDGYTIEDIDDDTVSLRRDNQQVVLAAPLHGGGRARELPPVRLRSAAAPGFDAAAPPAAVPSGPPAPVDPYGDPSRPADGAAPAPPPGDALPPEPGIRVAHAPSTAGPLSTGPALVPGEGGVRVATAPDAGPAAASWVPPSEARGGGTLPAEPGARPTVESITGSTATGPGAIRVVSAAPAAPSAALAAPGAPPAVPSALPAAPGAALAAPSAPPAAPSAAPAAPSAPSAGPGAALATPSAPPAAPSAAPAAPGSALAAPSPGPGASTPRGDLPPAPPAEPSGSPPLVSLRSSPPAPAVAIEPAADPRPPGIREVRAPDAARAPDRQTADARALADILTADRPTRSPRALGEPVAPRGGEPHPAASSAAAPGDGIAISRSELAGALADFARLTAGVRGSFSANGVAIDAVGDGTIFQRAGLRAGDVVTSVDGVRLRTLDDAANLYARASSARAITAQVVRAGKPITLHVVIQ